MANPLKAWAADQTERMHPPSDPAERQRFWIERGNHLLAKEGRGHLQWVCLNGYYKIEPRSDRGG